MERKNEKIKREKGTQLKTLKEKERNWGYRKMFNLRKMKYIEISKLYKMKKMK